MRSQLVKGRGSQINVENPFSKYYLSTEELDGLDEHELPKPTTRFFLETPKQIVSKSESPDLGLMHSINPYQGCEHGCSYCYARNSHTYWGFSSGLDFESRIIVKKDAPRMLEEYFNKYQGKVTPIFLSGNTDCYQPAERKYRLTRQLLEVCYKYRYPVSIISKNSLMLRDLDILEALANEHLVRVFVSITTFDESLRSIMEPRTATASKRLDLIEQLSNHGIPVGVMNAPIIPGLTDHETPAILEKTAAKGASTAGYTIVRLNGTIARLFEDWILKAFPAKAEKVLNQIAACHDGKLNDSEWHRRQKGSGNFAELIAQMFDKAFRKFYGERKMPIQDLTKFRRKGNYQLF
jgi:DNA repair photolyase